MHSFSGQGQLQLILTVWNKLEELSVPEELVQVVSLVLPAYRGGVKLRANL